MLQRFLDVKPRVNCDSVHFTVTEILQQLLIAGHGAVEIISRSEQRHLGADPQIVFDRVKAIFTEANLLDADVPVSQTQTGLRRLQIPNPYHAVRAFPQRIRVSELSEPVAALIHAFIVLRVRYQGTDSQDSPVVLLEANCSDERSLDFVYLIGDAFTERYPVIAEIRRKADKVLMRLLGEPALISGGLDWARSDYVRSRDVALLARPLRQAITEIDAPLAFPRQVRGALGTVFLRIPTPIRSRIKDIRWLSSLVELKDSVPGKGISEKGTFGEDGAIKPIGSGYIAAIGEKGIDTILPIRCLAPTSVPEAILPEALDNTLAVAFEALGGGREIGANTYYYNFGDRGLIIDLGFDATRDGWLGLPELERITRLDAIILTHAHLDHIGALPVALGAFPRVPIYCTRATKAVLAPQLFDSAKVGRLRFEETGEAPAVSHGLVAAMPSENFKVIPYDTPTPVPEIPGLTIQFQDAGHIIGSACVRLEFSGMSIIHTGDISVEDQHLLKGMQIHESAADHVIMEGTYCGEPTFTREHRRKAVHEFLAGIEERITAGGSVLVPAFSLGRAQELVGMLVDWNDHTGRDTPIWTVGLVNTLNDVSASLPEFLPLLKGTPFKRVKGFPQITGKTLEQRRDEYAREFFRIAQIAPSVIIASHGMMTENTGSYLIGRAILTGGDPRHAIFLCGYMDPRTPGFRLRQQCEAAVIDFGLKDTVNRTIPKERIQFHRLTAHASYEELVQVASRVPSKTLTFIHGDGDGLDSLRLEVLKDLEGQNRSVQIRAPAIGERFLLQRVPPPADWANELNDDPIAVSDSIGPGRFFDRTTDLTVSGLTPNRRWALIPLGRGSVVLRLERDRVSGDRIDRIQLRPRFGTVTVAFDRARNPGPPDRIEWSEPGSVKFEIFARDPKGQPVKSSFPFSCGAEVRLISSVISAMAPVVEFEIGGTSTPEFIEATYSQQGKKLDVNKAEWDAESRVMRLTLPPTSVGPIENCTVSLRWPNGFPQHGPNSWDITAEPAVTVLPSPVKVGVKADIKFSSSPLPNSARVGGQLALLHDDRIEFTPRYPGLTAIEFEYVQPESTNASEWREVAVIDVKAAVNVDLPYAICASKELVVEIREVEPTFHRLPLVLLVGGQIRDTWTAGPNQHSWAGSLDRTDEELEVLIAVRDHNLTLWAGTVRVYAGFELNRHSSLTVTTADGSLEARLDWLAIDDDSARDAIERAFRDCGFTLCGWSHDTLRIRGTGATCGYRDVTIRDGNRNLDVRILTLTDLKLRIDPPGPIELGNAATVATGGGQLIQGLHEIDQGPLSFDVDRINPLFDGLSARIVGNRLHFVYPGHYVIGLLAGSERLAELSVEVRMGKVPTLGIATVAREASFSTPYDASVYASELPVLDRTVITVQRRNYHVVQDSPSHLEESVWGFVCQCLDAGEKVLVSWPGLTFSTGVGDLLRRLRVEKPKVSVAHLSYPAPRGEVVPDELSARNLRRYRVLCCVRAHSLIDRQDSYICPSCNGRPLLKTDDHQMWMECEKCGFRDQELILTLNSLRSRDVQVLFADFRIAKYLSRGHGAKYSGSFGRSVRCGNCHSMQPMFAKPGPWDKAELHRLITALIAVWDSANPSASIRKAAQNAWKQSPRSRLADITRLEDALSALIDGKVLQNGRIVGSLDRLEAGLSTCCGSALMWSKSRLAHVFFNVEELISTNHGSFLHPDLSFGQNGVRQFLALSE